MPARMRHVRAIAVVMGATSLALAVSLPAQATTHRGTGIERAVLPAGDGWASADGSTTGGAGATPEHVYTVTDRAELIAAFEDAGDAPKIVRIAGTVHGNSDAEGTPIGCEAYQQGGYTLEKYLDAYDPAVWGTDEVAGWPAGGRAGRVREAPGRRGQRERAVQHHARRRRQGRHDHRCQPPGEERLQRHRPQHLLRGHLRLLPPVGPHRR